MRAGGGGEEWLEDKAFLLQSSSTHVTTGLRQGCMESEQQSISLIESLPARLLCVP